MPEDPGATTLSIITNLAKEAIEFAVNLLKSALSTGIEIIKFGVFMGYRMKMFHGQRPMEEQLYHGKQSLKHLREHEMVPNTHIESVGIGKDRQAKNELKHELSNERIDYSIEKQKNGSYTLYYKKSNEQDVLRAQQRALERRYGDVLGTRHNNQQETHSFEHRPETPLQQEAKRTPEQLQNHLRNADTLDAAVAKAKSTAQDKNAVLKLGRCRSPKARIKEIDLERLR